MKSTVDVRYLTRHLAHLFLIPCCLITEIIIGRPRSVLSSSTFYHQRNNTVYLWISLNVFFLYDRNKMVLYLKSLWNFAKYKLSLLYERNAGFVPLEVFKCFEHPFATGTTQRATNDVSMEKQRFDVSLSLHIQVNFAWSTRQVLEKLVVFLLVVSSFFSLLVKLKTLWNEEKR